MRNYLPHLLASALLVAGFGYTSLPAKAGIASHLPSSAMETTQNADVIKVRDHRRRYDHRRYDRRPDYRRHYRRPGPRHAVPRSGFFLEFGARPIYRPAPVYTRPPVYRTPRYSMSRAHVNWCASRYRSYRAYDNTFQPYNGPRRQCVSPY